MKKFLCCISRLSTNEVLGWFEVWSDNILLARTNAGKQYSETCHKRGSIPLRDSERYTEVIEE